MKCWSKTLGGLYALLGAALLLFTLAGCGGSDRTSVSGTFLRADGSALVGARVTARSSETGKWASGITNEDGHFELGVGEAGAGLPPGNYYVIIMEGTEAGGNPSTISAKYSNPSSSGLNLTIKPGEPTELNVTLDPP